MTATLSTGQMLRRSLIYTVITIIALVAAVWFGGRAWLAGSIMPYEGRAVVQGLDGPVEILFDARGIPRIYSQTDGDALKALGWLHAGERLFQMELIRRAAAGRLAEVLGPVALNTDGVHRALGFAHRVNQAEHQLDEHTLALVERYVTGINAYLDSAGRLPPEFLALRFQPEPWTVDDVVLVTYYQTWYPNVLVERLSEAWREIGEAFGEPASQWLAAIRPWAPSSVPGSSADDVPTWPITDSSNSWVVAPGRSASGQALHAADPHLDITMAPGTWYAAGLHSAEGLNVLGVTAPGIPVVAMGHNGYGAWSFTVAPVDVLEFYRQPIDPEDPSRVLGTDGWQTLDQRTEYLPVAGRPDTIPLTLEYTEHGVVIERHPDSVVSMRWVGFELPLDELLSNSLAVNRADSFESFRRAATGIGALSVNWLWSDREGNIGYVLGTPVPRRGHEQFFRILDGADQAMVWDGVHPPDALPHALNPEQGWLASSNNEIVDQHWPWPIPGFYKHLRIRRAAHWLSRPGPLDVPTMQRMQMDRISDRALTHRDWLADLAERHGAASLAADLRRWSGELTAASELGGLFVHFWQVLPEHLFANTDVADWRTLRNVLDEWLQEPPDFAGIDQQAIDEAGLAALREVLSHGIHPLGEMQTLTIAHPLNQAGFLNRWLKLTRGPIPTGSDAGSLNVSYSRWHRDQQRLSVIAGASMRYIMDWSDPDSFTLNLTLGQSGHPLSPHFDDFLPAFINGQPWTVPWQRETVEQRSRRRLELVPARAE